MSRGRTHPRSRPAVVYLYTLLVSVVLTTIGVGLVHVTRVNARAMTQEAEIAAARALARAAVEDLLQVIQGNSGWRASFVAGSWQPERTLGRGTVSIKWQAIDGSTARIYGRGTVGGAVRVYSAEVQSRAVPLEILGAAVHSALDVTVSSDTIVRGGPVSSNSAVSVAATGSIDGDAEAPVILNLGTITGASRISLPKDMPQTTIFSDLRAVSTEIPFASLNSGKLESAVLSPASNPFGGGLNALGVYYIRVPAAQKLTITNVRVVGTLLVDLIGTGRVETSAEYRLEPASADRPTLVVRADTLSGIDFPGSSSLLMEAKAKANLNPVGTPYPYPGGATDGDSSDTYAVEMVGVIHIIAPITATVSLGSKFVARGCVISHGPVQLKSKTDITVDPAIILSPPTGYSSAAAWSIVAGSWRWEPAG